MPNQEFKYQHFVMSLISSIKAEQVTAIATINKSSAYLQYIFSPKVYKNLQGKPTAIVGNASDAIEKFMLLHVDIMCFCSFITINKKSAFNTVLTLEKNIPDDFFLIPFEVRNLLHWLQLSCRTSLPSTLGRRLHMATFGWKMFNTR